MYQNYTILVTSKALRAVDIRNDIQGDQKVSMHLTITVQN